ncbi:alpha/beta fold hydrolase [Paroceanicella profunda]|uniref:alpha/beta fold hydrolase n=1 Tax=Paroceanicella profunda TaxID=2579971 RepID=UPI001980A920|nr:alpha/beta fold hydrolase [Paroceanicella profunda]
MALAPLAGDDRFPWAPSLLDRGRAIGPLDQVSVAHEAARRLGDFVRGVEAWQTHPHARRLADPPALWQSGASRLLDFGGRGPAVVAIPSLINRAYVLDLSAETSLVRHLAGRGLRVFLVDWGVPGPAEAGFDLTAWHDLRLAPMLAAARAAAGPVALLGYCMGGALAAAAAQIAPESLRGLALIGTPWSFEGGPGMGPTLRGMAREYGAQRLTDELMAMDKAFGAVPSDLLQLLFALLDPGLALAKFRRFGRFDPGSPRARRFVELEDWLNDPVPLPGPAAVEILVDWQIRNLTGAGAWWLSGTRIDPARIRLPALAFCSRTDRIAPQASTLPLARAIPGARLREPHSGHVGMIVGSRARREVWDPLREFLADPPDGDQYRQR